MISGKELHSLIIAKILILQNRRIAIDEKVNEMQQDKIEPTEKELNILLNEIEEIFPDIDPIEELSRHEIWNRFVGFEDILSSVDMVIKNSMVKPMIVLEKLLPKVDVDADISDKKYCFENGILIELTMNKNTEKFEKHILASKKELNHTGLNKEF